ncbi:hypothetical protein [Streptomyces sp. GS7]|uniref:hypothetical protein n=1 Tax=Streptomyces sp. GS7 TaxID=2692234 RepID=UPI0013168683|nr:hypothetical protein [Streptomyces sp. GS7]QHC21408.1 hypothetical protein GR130_08170 [Streptomyces sp. GS7]
MNDINHIANGLKKPFGVALEGDYLYVTMWGSGGTAGSVVRVNKKDVKSEPVTIATGLDMPCDVTVDREYLYIAVDADKDRSVVRVKKDGTDPTHNKTIAGRLTCPGGVAVDDEYLYLTNLDSKIPPPPHDSVMKVKKDGSEPTHHTIITDTDLNRPSALVMDGEYLYFTNLEGGSVDRVKKDGSARANIAGGLNTPCSVAKDREYLYIVQEEDGSVVRVNKNGSPAPVTVATGLKDPLGVAVDGDDLYIISRGTNSVVKVRMRVPA